MKKLELLAWALIFIWVLLAGCTQYIAEIPEKNIRIQVNTLFEDKEVSGLEWVFDDGSYFSVDKTSSQVNPEWLQMLQYLHSAGLLSVQSPVAP